ncbi:hypothetical protein WDU94_013031 [Cyamophila willieti]
MNIFKDIKLANFKVKSPHTEKYPRKAKRRRQKTRIFEDTELQTFPEDRLVNPEDPNKHLELEEVAAYAKKRERSPENVNIDIETNDEPLEIEIEDEETSTVQHFEGAALVNNMRKNSDKMDVYNELKLSVLNKEKNLKHHKFDDETMDEINQIAYSPHSYYGHEDTYKMDSSSFKPKTYYPKMSLSNQNPTLSFLGDPCCPDTACQPKAIKCINPCCRTFDSRDLAFVFLFGLIVGLLAIIAITILYSVFFVIRRSCCAMDPYEITLTRDHHYRDPEECITCYKCKKCCECVMEEPCFKRCRVNRPLIGSISDAIPTSKWRLCPKRNVSCHPIGCGS